MSYILIVEDDQYIAETMTMVLYEEGVSTQCAGNTTDARLIFDRDPPKCILLDYWLKNDTPTEFVEYVRSRGDVSIVLVTAAVKPEVLAEDLNICHVIKKPFEIEQLIAAVRLCAPSLLA